MELATLSTTVQCLYAAAFLLISFILFVFILSQDMKQIEVELIPLLNDTKKLFNDEVTYRVIIRFVYHKQSQFIHS